MGVRVAHNLVSANILDYIELSEDYSVMEIQALEEWSGSTLKDVKLRSKYGINVMAIKRGDEVNLSPAAEDIIESGDIIVAIGSAEDLSRLEGMIVNSR